MSLLDVVAGSDWVAVVMPLAASAATGAVIGFEREFNAKSAGLRTHTLVCLSSALLMMAAVNQSDWQFRPIPGTSVVSDPTRMAQGVLTGIGFLGAGVIFRQGTVVHGLTTAASLWMTAALGILYGAGLNGLAAAGTAATLAVLVLFRIFQIVIPDRIEVCVRARCSGDAAAAALLGLLRDRAAQVTPLEWTSASPGPGGGGAEAPVRLAASVWLGGPGDLVPLGAELRSQSGISEVAILPVLASGQA